MHSTVLHSILIFLTITAPATPHPTTNPRPRQTTLSNTPPTTGITITITSSNGTNITPSFQTLLYDGRTNDTAPSNLTERQTRPSLIHPIDYCEARNAVFAHSECTYNPGHARRSSLRGYKVRCISPPGIFTFEIGSCAGPDDVCVNGPLTEWGAPTVANCIGQGGFRDISEQRVPNLEEEMEAFLKDRSAGVVLSQLDRQTALRVGSLEIDAGIAGGDVGLMRSEKCRSCVGVSTERLGEGTVFLSAEVVVGSAATAVVGGVLWLAILSG